MRKLIVLLFATVLNYSLIAQQESLFSVYWNNISSINPGTTGEQSKYYLAANFRNQWRDVKGGPKTFNTLFELQLDSINSAFGLAYTYDQLGLENTNKINLNYAYHFKLSNDRKIGIGIAPSFAIKSFNNNEFIAIDDYTLDPSIPNETNKKFNYFDINIGISFKGKKLKAGFGSTQFLESGSEIYRNTRNFFAHGSYDYLLGTKFKLIQRIRVASNLTLYAYEVSLVGCYNEQFWIGGSYRSNAVLGGVIGVDIVKKVRLGYSYDYYIDVQSYFGTSHEIVFAIII